MPDHLEHQLVEALEHAEQKYRVLVEHAVEGVFRTTPDGRFVMANQALAGMLGFETPAQLIAERIDLERNHYVRAEERARFRRLIDMQGIVVGFEYEAYRRDGTRIWLRDHARAVSEPDGTVYYEGTVEDITNRRRAEDLLELRARQQATVAKLGQIALSSSDLPALLDCAASLTAETLNVEFVQVLELQPDGNLQFRAGVGWRNELLRNAVPGGAASQAGRTLASKQPVLVNDWRTAPDDEPAHLREHGIRSGVTVIIGTTGHPYGVLGAHATTIRSFIADDVNFLQGIASILAGAIVRHRADEMRMHLLSRAISAQEEERSRIARELHDETGQALSAVLVGLRGVEEAKSLEEVRAMVARLRDITSQTIRDVGRIARGLRPSTLDDLGLLAALQRYGDELHAARGIDVRITGEQTARLPSDTETTLYRIIQEALTNVARHADAHVVTVSIERRNGAVRATIHDDGRGFDVPTALGTFGGERTLGLVGIQERASLLGGTVAIESQPGGGARIVVELPIEPAS